MNSRQQDSLNDAIEKTKALLVELQRPVEHDYHTLWVLRSKANEVSAILYNTAYSVRDSEKGVQS